MIGWLFALTVAHADPVGHYHPVDVGAASAQFAAAQEVAGVAFQSRQERAQAIAAALNAYEAQLDLLGDQDGVAPHRDRHRRLVATFQREQAVLSAFAQDQLDGFDTLFSNALVRALGDRQASVCHDDGGRVRMGPRFATGGRQTCEGPSLNEELAATMDADPALADALGELLAQDWPDLTLEPIALPAVGDGTATLAPLAVVRHGARAPLAALAQADEDARLPLQAALEQDPTADEVSALRARGRTLTETTAARRAELAEPILDAVERVADKGARKGGPTIAWCPQPELLGGCEPSPATSAQAAELLDHGKVQRAYAKAAR